MPDHAGWRRLGPAVALLALVMFVTTGSGAEGRDGSIDVDRGRDCTLGAKAVPSCGVLWGISTKPRTVAQLRSVETAVGRRFDLVYRYLDINSRFPGQVERRIVAGGRLLHIAIAARNFQGGQSPVTWRDVAKGKYDASLAAQARGVASLREPVFVTFSQEANATTKLGTVGTAADFKAAWRHLYRLYQRVGATNAVWTWVMQGSVANLRRAASLWPGNDVVDWISWNVYNRSGCGRGVVRPDTFESFQDRMSGFYDFVRTRGKAIGMDPSKPMMISEAGSVRYATAPDLSADWYAAIPSALRNYPQVKAVTLWDSATATCDYRFDRSPVTTAGVRRAGLDPTIRATTALAHPRHP